MFERLESGEVGDMRRWTERCPKKDARRPGRAAFPFRANLIWQMTKEHRTLVNLVRQKAKHADSLVEAYSYQLAQGRGSVMPNRKYCLLKWVYMGIPENE